MDINKIISIIRSLKEEGMGAGAVSGGPTNSLSQGKIAGTIEAGDNPPVKKKKYIYGTGFRKNWLQKRSAPNI
jgi:hypothetical protein